MKRQRLRAEYEIDFVLLGIVSAFRDFKLAWNLNHKLHLDLVKKKDLRLQFLDHEIVASNFLYQTENSQMWLIKNRSHQMEEHEGRYLVPELTEMDYFLRISGAEIDSDWLSSLRAITGIDYVYKIDLDQLKSKENFIF